MSLDAVLDRRLLIISGKGGVGKTTVAAALGVLAARHDRKVLLVEVEGRKTLSGIFDLPPLTETPTEVHAGLFAMNVSPTQALQEYFEIQLHMKRIARPLISSQLVYYVTHAAPGLRDILMLGKVWHDAVRKREFDLIVLDTPAAGHAVSMLRSPEGFLQAVPVGPLATHARQVAEWLKDPQQVSIHLVSMAEEMPVSETIETTHMLEEIAGIDVNGVYVNMLYPPLFRQESPALTLEFLSEESDRVGGGIDEQMLRGLASCASFYNSRRALQQEHRKTLGDNLEQTAPIVDLPFFFVESFGTAQIDDMADAIEAQLQ